MSWDEFVLSQFTCNSEDQDQSLHFSSRKKSMDPNRKTPCRLPARKPGAVQNTRVVSYQTAPPYPTGITGAYTLPPSVTQPHPQPPPPVQTTRVIHVHHYHNTPQPPPVYHQTQPIQPVYGQYQGTPRSTQPLPPDPILTPAFCTAHLNPGRR